MNLARRTWTQTAIVAALTLPGGMSLLLARAAFAQSNMQAFHQVSGTVRVNGEVAIIGTPIGLGDLITTAGDSEAVFSVGADAFSIRGSSEVELSGNGVIAQTLSVLTGAILGVFGPRDTEIIIDTPIATAGIRGTAAYTISEPTRSYICICYGSAVLTSKAVPGANESVKTSHHESPRYINLPGQGATIEQANVIDHTDQELRMLEALVGRTPPKSWLDLSPEERYDLPTDPVG
jgi:hypothetical protein